MWQKEYTGSKLSSTQAEDYCSDLMLAGFFDWRVPGDFELMTIVYFGMSVHADNGTYFSNTRTDYPWWTQAAGNSSSLNTSKWQVDFTDGSLSIATLFADGYARCVRNGQHPQRIHVDNGNGTITDRTTRLMWQKQDDGGTALWVDAIAACETLSLGGYADWRLPNVKELRSIVDTGTYAPAITNRYFPNTRTDSYWSSTTCASSTGGAWRINFWHGEVEISSKGNAHFVRCVRGGE
jgi:hypothetical protein